MSHQALTGAASLNSSQRPRIHGPLPGPLALKLLELQQAYESSAVSYPKSLPLVPLRAEGVWIEDVDGNIFLDAASMAGVLTLGHSAAALKEFLECASRLMTTLDYPTIPRIEFLEALRRALHQTLGAAMKVHLTSPTGTNAVEAAAKLCRWRTGASTIIAFTGSYHGMSAGSAALSHLPEGPRFVMQGSDRTPFVNYPYCYRCPLNLRPETCEVECLGEVEETILKAENRGEKVAAAIIEPVQGEGGSVAAPAKYLQGLYHLLHRHGALLIADEVQCGFGRTGTLFAIERAGVTPDVLVFSKGVSGVGAPMAGIAFKEELDGWPPGSHIGTFRGFVPAFASAVVSLDRLTTSGILEDVRNNSAEAKEFLDRELADADVVGEIRWSGYMGGIEIVRSRASREPDPDLARRVRRSLFNHGILVELGGRFNNVIRLLPPLVMDLETLLFAMETLSREITGACAAAHA